MSQWRQRLRWGNSCLLSGSSYLVLKGLSLKGKERRSVSSKAILAPLLVILLTAVGYSDSRSEKEPPDLSIARPLIESYLQALARGDSDAITALIPQGYETEIAIASRIERYGGIDPSAVRFVIEADISPKYPIARIEFSRTGHQTLQWTEQLVWSSGRWRLVLGESSERPTRPSSDTNRSTSSTNHGLVNQ